MIFKGEILNDKQVTELFNKAPKVYMRYFKNYLIWSGKRFIGNKITSLVTHKSGKRTYTRKVSIQQNGTIRQMLANHDAVRGGKWTQKFINTAVNFKVDDNMTMRAGVLYNTKKKIHEIIEQMESGFTRSTSKYMIIPNYSELGTSVYKPIGLFSSMLNSKQLIPIFARGNFYYINKKTNRIMFVGKRRIKVQSQFDFYSAWRTIEPIIKAKSADILDKATKAVEEGKYA